MARQIPGLSDAFTAGKFLSNLHLTGIQPLWNAMSSQQRQKIKDKNMLIAYQNEKIDSTGYHIDAEPPLKVTKSDT